MALRTPCSMSASVRTGELQAVGQVGAVAVAQGDAAAHDVVAEPFQGASIHTGIMTHQGRHDACMDRRALERLGHHIVSRRVTLGYRNRTDLANSLQFTRAHAGRHRARRA